MQATMTLQDFSIYPKASLSLSSFCGVAVSALRHNLLDLSVRVCGILRGTRRVRTENVSIRVGKAVDV